MLAAVEQSIRESGVSRLSLRQVSRRVGVSNRAPAHHFKDKAGLLTEFAIEGYELLAQTVINSISRSKATSGLEVLAACGAGYVRFAMAHREHFEVMFRLDLVNRDDERFVAASDRAYSLLTSTIELCAGEKRLGGRSPGLVAVSAWSLVHGLAALWLSGRLSERIAESDPERLAKDVSELFVESVLTPSTVED